MRMTEQEARAVAAENGEQAGIVVGLLDWSQPAEAARQCYVYSGQCGPVSGIAAVRIADALVAYKAHLDFVAGRAAMRQVALDEIAYEIRSAEQVKRLTPEERRAVVQFLEYAAKHVAERA